MANQEAIWALQRINEAAIPLLAGRLQRGEEPATTLQALAGLGTTAASLAPLAIPYASDRRPTIRALALEALATMGGSAQLSGLISTGLADQEPHVRQAAVHALSMFPGADAEDLLVRALSDQDEEVAVAAILAIPYLVPTPARIMPLLFRRCSSADRLTRNLVACTVGMLASGNVGESYTERLGILADDATKRQAHEAELAILDDPDHDVQNSAFMALGMIGISDHALRTSLLRRIGEDPHANWNIRDCPWHLALGDEDVDDVIVLMSNPVAEVRQFACIVAETVRTRNPRLVAKLTACLSDSDALTRGDAAHALGTFGQSALPAFAALLALIDDQNRYAADRAIASLGRLGPGGVALLRAELRAGRNPEAIATALVEAAADAAPAVPELIALLESPDEPVRLAALQALRAIGPVATGARIAVIRRLNPGVAGPPSSTAERGSALMALCAFTLDAETAALLDPSVDEALDPSTLSDQVFKALLPWPAFAGPFIVHHPQALNGATAEALVAGWLPGPTQLRQLILVQPGLPIRLMAMSGDVVFLPRIRALASQETDAYTRSTALRYAMVLDDRPGEGEAIDAVHPGDFRPTSAWPGKERKRMSRARQGGLNGPTAIVISGRIRMSDGTPPPAVSFTSLNDRMNLGRRLEQPEHALYIPATGHFALFTTVYAEFDGGHEIEQGPYQTRCVQLRLTASGAVPLILTGYDEMPSVVITLQPDIHAPSGGARPANATPAEGPAKAANENR
jgi:HEAT repeat protein